MPPRFSDPSRKGKGKMERNSPKMVGTHTTIVGLDCGDFVILGTDSRLTAPDGEVLNDDFTKHAKINDKVQLVFSGDVKAAFNYIYRLRQKLKGDDRAFDIDHVAMVAARLLEKISREERKKEEERTNKVLGEKLERALNIILAGWSTATSRVCMYTIDSDFMPKSVVIASGGSGITLANDYILSSGHTKESLAKMNVEAAKTFVKNIIHHCIMNDWRSGGKIRQSVTWKAKKKKNVTFVYCQQNPASCTNLYDLKSNETFIVDYPPPEAPPTMC